jgi:hypothetical protein
MINYLTCNGFTLGRAYRERLAKCKAFLIQNGRTGRYRSKIKLRKRYPRRHIRKIPESDIPHYEISPSKLMLNPEVFIRLIDFGPAGYIADASRTSGHRLGPTILLFDLRIK